MDGRETGLRFSAHLHQVPAASLCWLARGHREHWTSLKTAACSYSLFSLCSSHNSDKSPSRKLSCYSRKDGYRQQLPSGCWGNNSFPEAQEKSKVWQSCPKLKRAGEELCVLAEIQHFTLLKEVSLGNNSLHSAWLFTCRGRGEGCSGWGQNRYSPR